jgi:hypothetical protein
MDMPTSFLVDTSFINYRNFRPDTVVSKSVANPWRDPKIAVMAGQKAVKNWIRQLRRK